MCGSQDAGPQLLRWPALRELRRVLHARGKLTGPIDTFGHPFWQSVRLRVAEKAVEMRKQGFFGPAMLPMGELEYTGIMEKLEALDKRFVVRTERA